MAPKQKTRTIIVNGTEHEWPDKKISYQDVVNLAYDGNPPSGDNITFTVAYFKGQSGQEGFLNPESKPVNVRKGMQFRVKHSTRS